MHTFKDCEGRTWEIRLSIHAVREVRNSIGFDLLPREKKDAEEMVKRIMIEPETLCDIIYVLCRDQAEKAGITDEDFGRSMAGDAIEHATDALVKEMIVFFPNARDREMAKRALEWMEKTKGEFRDHLEEEFDAIMQKRAKKALAKAKKSIGTLG